MYHGYADQNDLNNQLREYVRECVREYVQQSILAGECCLWCKGRVEKNEVCYVCFGETWNKVQPDGANRGVLP